MSDTDLAFRCTLDGSGFASGMQNINSQLSDLGVRTNSATASLGPLGTLMGTLANPLTAVALGITAVGVAMAASVGAAAAWQTGMAGVQKTTGLSGEPLQALSQQLLDLSTTMPIASSELANIAQVAGSLGVATGEIVNFTQSAAMMAVAFEMPAEQAATMGAKILTAYQQPISSMQNLGNTVNALGDSFAATEPQILDFVNRASFLNTTFGQTIPQVAALGTVLISAGMDADLAATGIKSILNIGLQEKFSGRGITAWAELLGTTVEEAKEKIATDLNGALVETADKIAAIEDPVKRFNTAVAIAGTEGAPALLKLAGQADNLQTALQKANGEWENGSSMMKTFEANSATLNSQMDIFWNTLNKAGVELGNVLLPHITKLVVGLTDAAKAAISLGEAIYGAMSSGYEVTKVGGGLDQWLYSATGGLLGTTPEMAEMAQNAGTGTADEWVNGLTGGISDSYTEIDGTMTDTLVGAGESAGAAGGEAAGKAWAKAQADWIKTYGWQAEQGMTRQAIYSTEKGHENDVVGYTPFTYTGYTEPTPAEAWKPTAPLNVSLEAGWDKGEVIRLITERAGALSEYIDSEGNKRLKDSETSKYVDYADNTVKGMIKRLGDVYNYTEREAAALIWSTPTGAGTIWQALEERDAQGLEEFKVKYADIESQANQILTSRAERIISAEEAAHYQEQLTAWLKTLPVDMQMASEAAKRLMFDVQNSMTAIATPEAKINPEAWTTVFNALSQDVIKDTDWPKIDDALEVMARSGADPALVSQARDYLKSRIEEITDIDIGLRYKLNWEEFWLKNKDAALKGLTNAQMFDIFNMEPFIEKMGPGVQHAWAIMWQGLESPSKEMEPLVIDAIKSMIGIIPNFTPELAQALIDLYVGGIQEAKPSIIDALTGVAREINSVSLADLLKNPDELTKSVSNWPQWIENTFQPTLKKSFDDIYRVSQSGYDQDIKASQDWIAEKEKILSQHSSWFKNWQADLLNMYSQNRISSEDLLWVWDQMENKSTKTVDSLNNQAVGYNQLQKAMEDCSECAISDFGEWQESQDNLFQGAYLGPGEGYLAWKSQQVQDIAATQRAMQAAGGAVLGKSYMESPLLSYQMDLDTSLAEGKLKTFQGDLQKPSEMAMDLKTDAAEASKMALETSIESADPIMSVILETNAAYAAAANLAASISSLSPVVYVDVIPLISPGDLAAMISNAIGGSSY